MSSSAAVMRLAMEETSSSLEGPARPVIRARRRCDRLMCCWRSWRKTNGFKQTITNGQGRRDTHDLGMDTVPWAMDSFEGESYHATVLTLQGSRINGGKGDEKACQKQREGETELHDGDSR